MLSKNAELFNVINSFQNLLDSEFTLKKKTRKIEKWADVEFSEFCKEFENQIKPNKLTLSQKSEWMVHFETEKVRAVAIKNKAAQIDREINQLVYKLYELTPEEIDMVEQEQL